MADALAGGIIINEILVDPNSTTDNFDTDNNGVADNTDEFVELYNASSGAIDISGFELWDAAGNNWFTFDPGTSLAAGGHAIVTTGYNGGGGPNIGPNDQAFDAGSGTAVLNNGAENVYLFDPNTDQYIEAMYNGASHMDLTSVNGFTGPATQVGSGEDFGSDMDGNSIQRETDGANTFMNDQGATAGITNGMAPVCFTDDALILTPKGEVPVAELSVGDAVTTSDGKTAKIRWVGRQSFTTAQLADATRLRPIYFTKGSLGPNKPTRDTRLSRAHGIAVFGSIAQVLNKSDSALIPAKHFLGRKGVAWVIPKDGVTYYHFMLDQHALVTANGITCETLLLDDLAKGIFPAKSPREAQAVFGDDLPTDWVVPKVVTRKTKTLNTTLARSVFL